MITSALDPNRVYENEHGIIEIQVVGSQTPESVGRMAEAAKKLLDASDKKLLLDDVTKMGDVSKAARHKVVDYGRSLNYNKLALLGTSGFLQLGSNLMLQAIGKGGKVQYFTDRDKAVKWLLAK